MGDVSSISYFEPERSSERRGIGVDSLSLNGTVGGGWSGE
jgi:hypothetical protein